MINILFAPIHWLIGLLVKKDYDSFANFVLKSASTRKQADEFLQSKEAVDWIVYRLFWGKIRWFLLGFSICLLAVLVLNIFNLITITF